MKYFHRKGPGTKIHIGLNTGDSVFCGFKSRWAEDFPTDFRFLENGMIEYSSISRRYGFEALGQADLKECFCAKCLKKLKTYK